MLKTIITGALALTTLGTGATAVVLNAESNVEPVYFEASFDTSIDYSVEQMLVLAIEDEYLAKATYTKLLELFPEEEKLTRLINAEQNHIEALLPLFETYNIAVPTDNHGSLVLSFETFQQAAVAIADAELTNISMYQHFLKQSNTPEDIKVVFGYLLAGSMRHLQAAQVSAFDLPNPNRARGPFAKGFMAGMKRRQIAPRNNS